MTVYLLTLILFCLGIYCVVRKRNVIKIIIGIIILEYAVNLFFILIGFIKGGTAPIITDRFPSGPYVDPLPQAMILTAIVLGLPTTALLLAIAIRLYRKYGTFDIRKINSLKG